MKWRRLVTGWSILHYGEETQTPGARILARFRSLAVVLHHFRYGSLLSDNAFIRHGYLMVDFFFVLSGFVIALNYANRLSSPAELASFQRRRFWRLYPLHLFTLLIFFGIECLKYIFEQKTGIISNNPAFVVSDAKAFLANLFLLQGVVLSEPGFNIPSWSISVEFWTYLIFASTMGLLRHRMRWSLVLAGLAAIILLALEGGQLQTDPIFAIIRCIFSFFWAHGPLHFKSGFTEEAPAPIAAGRSDARRCGDLGYRRQHVRKSFTTSFCRGSCGRREPAGGYDPRTLSRVAVLRLVGDRQL